MPGCDKHNPTSLSATNTGEESSRLRLQKGRNGIPGAQPRDEFRPCRGELRKFDLDTTYPTVYPTTVICQIFGLALHEPFLVLPCPFHVHIRKGPLKLCPDLANQPSQEEPLVTSAFRASENGALLPGIPRAHMISWKIHDFWKYPLLSLLV